MTDDPPEISILDARLAEIDRRLSSIQTGLADDISVERRAPAPAAPAVPAAVEPLGPAVEPLGPAVEAPPRLPPRVEIAEPPGPAPTVEELVGELRSLAGAHERVLVATRELLSVYERVLARLPQAGSTPAVREFSVSAGPFGSTEALRRFERMLTEIAEVREVSVRGYEGEDRAIVDVHLFEPNT